MSEETRKIVINRCYGGFSLSEEVVKELSLASPYDEIARDDPRLIALVEKLGHGAGSRFSALEVVEIPADVNWHIEEYDGNEWVAEDHRTWR